MSNPQYPQGGFPDGQNPGPQDPGQPQGYPGEQQYPSAPPPASAASASGGWGQTSLRPIQGAGAQPVQPGSRRRPRH